MCWQSYAQSVWVLRHEYTVKLAAEKWDKSYELCLSNVIGCIQKHEGRKFDL